MNVSNAQLNELWKILRLLGWSAVALVLLAPAVAMQFTDEINWDIGDFAFVGALLIGGGALIELVAWQVTNPVIRIGVSLFVIAVVGLVWVEAAVGVFH